MTPQKVALITGITAQDGSCAFYQVLRLLEANPQMSQRELAAALGVSLGKTNFCLKALLDKGLLKMRSALLKLHPKEAKIPPCA